MDEHERDDADADRDWHQLDGSVKNECKAVHLNGP